MRFTAVQSEILRIAGFPGTFEIISNTTSENLCGADLMLNFDAEDQDGNRNREAFFKLVSIGYIKKEDAETYRLTAIGLEAQKVLHGVFEDKAPPDGREN